MTDRRAQVLNVDSGFEAANRELYECGETDGLPVVPPTQARVDEIVAGTTRDRDDALGEIPPRYGVATVETLALNAVVAGCDPAYMPMLVAVVEATCEPEFNLYGINATTHPVAPLVVVNGPITEDLGLNYGYNAFVGGFNPAAVEAAVAAGARTVWLPTFSAAAFGPGDVGVQLPVSCGSLTVFDEDSSVRDDVREEMFAVLNAIQAVTDHLETVSEDRCVLSTDHGQPSNRLPPEAYERFVALLRNAGGPDRTLKRAAATTPREVLGAGR
jgi:hypothetical protein